MRNLNAPGQTWCGQVVGPGFAFEDGVHARLAVAEGTRVQPCPACWTALAPAPPSETVPDAEFDAVLAEVLEKYGDVLRQL